MKLSKIIKTIEVIEEKRVPNDILEGFLYHSASRQEPIQIHDMDVVHLVRAFKNALHKLDNQFIDKDLIKENSELKKEVAYLRSTTEAVIDEMNELKKQLEKEKV
jgi:hypothetical protein